MLLPSAAEEVSGDGFQVGAGGKHDGGGGAGGGTAHERAHQRDQKPLGAGRVLGSERRAHHSGVEGVGGDRGPLKPPCELVGEEDGRELGLVVGAGSGVAVFALEVVEVDTPEALRVG